MSTYRKFFVALVGAAVSYFGRRWGIDNPAYVDLVAVLTALGVYVAPNG